MKSQYPRNPLTMNCTDLGLQDSLEFAIALRMIEGYGLVAAVRGQDDTAGRAALELLSAEDVVTRACDIAERFVTEAENRGWVEPITATPEDAAAYRGKLVGITSDAQYSPERREADKEAMRAIRGIRHRDEETETAAV